MAELVKDARVVLAAEPAGAALVGGCAAVEPLGARDAKWRAQAGGAAVHTNVAIDSLTSVQVSLLLRLSGAHASPREPPWWLSAGEDDLVVVTGGSHGVGLAVTRSFAAQGVRVVLTAPDAEAARAAAQELGLSCSCGGRVTALVLDQRSSAGVDSFVDALHTACAASGWRVRALVCNAATMAVEEQRTPESGDERARERIAVAATAHKLPLILAVNHLGTWRLLTRLHARGLLPRGARVVVVSSFTHRCVSASQLLAWLAGWSSSPSFAGGPTPVATEYARSKAAVSCAAAHFAALHGGALSVALADPGLVDTLLTRHWPPRLRGASRSLGTALGLMRPPQAGAAAVLAALRGDHSAGSTVPYFFGQHGVRLAPARTGGGHAWLARAVWAATEALDLVCE